jgi:soluble lytic murein transglycosylase
MERIPFSETRNYVHRVLENLQVYRFRLEGRKLELAQDLKRGIGAKSSSMTGSVPEKSAGGIGALIFGGSSNR